MEPFIVFAMPRSRSAWLSRYLTYKEYLCGHDELRHCRSLEDIRSWFAQPCVGTVETAAAPFWRLAPPARYVTLRRPIDAVLASLRRGGMAFDDDVMRAVLKHHEAKLNQIEKRLPNVLRLTFDELADESACADLFTHCLPYPHDHDWWQACAAVNIQASLPLMMRYAVAYATQTEKLRRLAQHEILRRFTRSHALDGITFQQEGLWQAFNDRDGQRLMAEECVMMGEEPAAWRAMNIPLLERIEATGNLHIMTARSNGRMFAYLVTALGEAFHARDQLEADQVSFFADPTWPGLGRKLQQAAIDDLRAHGVNRVLMFQPDSTRVGLLYRRLGAKQTGQRFVLELQ